MQKIKDGGAFLLSIAGMIAIMALWFYIDVLWTNFKVWIYN